MVGACRAEPGGFNDLFGAFSVVTFRILTGQDTNWPSLFRISYIVSHDGLCTTIRPACRAVTQERCDADSFFR